MAEGRMGVGPEKGMRAEITQIPARLPMVIAVLYMVYNSI